MLGELIHRELITATFISCLLNIIKLASFPIIHSPYIYYTWKYLIFMYSIMYNLCFHSAWRNKHLQVQLDYLFSVLFSYETLSKGKAYAIQLSTNTWPGRLFGLRLARTLCSSLATNICRTCIFLDAQFTAFTFSSIRPWALFAAHLTLLKITLRIMYNVKLFSAVENAA